MIVTSRMRTAGECWRSEVDDQKQSMRKFEEAYKASIAWDLPC